MQDRNRVSEEYDSFHPLTKPLDEARGAVFITPSFP
jgi:hypothetical protein